MSGLTVTAAESWLNLIFRAAAVTVDGVAIDWGAGSNKGFYLGLFTAMPTPTSSGTEVTTSGTDYARVLLDVTTSPVMSVGTSGNEAYAYNTNAISFSTGITGAWGTIVGFGLFSASTSGNLHFFGPLTASFTPSASDPIIVPAGALRINFNPTS